MVLAQAGALAAGEVVPRPEGAAGRVAARPLARSPTVVAHRGGRCHTAVRAAAAAGRHGEGAGGGTDSGTGGWTSGTGTMSAAQYSEAPNGHLGLTMRVGKRAVVDRMPPEDRVTVERTTSTSRWLPLLPLCGFRCRAQNARALLVPGALVSTGCELSLKILPVVVVAVAVVVYCGVLQGIMRNLCIKYSKPSPAIP